ncbi:cupin domain-containing protein [Nocardia sp. NPDC050710]|uniref:cupin domain-containing protein n=1 Tax=Nocardia sp. NPDC050710 TaxID=3157220 RepID=UPI0033D37F64
MAEKCTPDDAVEIAKHGVELSVYNTSTSVASVAQVGVAAGHFEEFYDTVSTYMYYLSSGTGTFVLDDKHIQVEEGDLVVAPPGTRIHYFGTMELLLTLVPPFAPENERHVRDVDPSESPYR